MARGPEARSTRPPSVLGQLTPAERGEVLSKLVVAHPDLEVEAERVARELLVSTTVEDVGVQVASVLGDLAVDDLAARAGRVLGRGYVQENEAAWELLEEVFEPFLIDLRRRATLGLMDAAAITAIGIIVGLYELRDPEDGTVVSYAGPDALGELADLVLAEVERVGISLPDEARDHWPDWTIIS